MRYEANVTFSIYRYLDIYCIDALRRITQDATNPNYQYETFKKYSKVVNDQSEKACTLRSLFRFKRNHPSISIDEVEQSVWDIVSRVL